MTFPTPIGGVPYHIDLAPSVIFAVAYGCLLPLVAYRIWDKNSRTVMLLGTIIFAVERIVAFSLRAAQATDEGKRFSLSLTAYIQSDLALGYIGIASDLSNLLRTMLVTPTYGSETYIQSTEAESRWKFWLTTAKLSDPEVNGKSNQRDFPGKPPAGTPDHPNTRFWVRRGTRFTGLAFLAATITGIISTGSFVPMVKGETSVHRVEVLRYVSTAVALFLMLFVIGEALWGYFFLPRVNRQGCTILCAITGLTIVIAIYRLSVMHNSIDSLQSTGPGSLSSSTDKALFYVFHVLPEWLSTSLLLIFNTRRIFSTGFVGDWRYRDETPKELEQRLKGEAKHREKLKLRELKLSAPEPALTKH